MSEQQGHDTSRAPGEEPYRLLVQSVRDYAIFMLDPSGHVRTWNPGAERFEGYTADEIVGQHFSRFYPPEALSSGLPAHELKVASELGSFEHEGWRVRKDGSQFWANMIITAMRDASGELVGFAKVTRDLTDRRNHEEALRQSEERFRLLVEGVKEYAIFMLDVNGMVASWNAGAQRIKGYEAREILGRHFSVFYPPEARGIGWPQHELEQATEHGSFVDEGWRVRKDGSAMWAHVTITALRDNAGKLLGFAKLTQDLTERKRVEAVTADSQLREDILEAERNARMAAQRATRIKDEFLATLSHELRTPLSAIMGWTQVLKAAGQNASPADVGRAVEVTERNARAQVQLIDDLLDMSGILSGKVRLDLKQVALPEVVRAAIDSVMPAASNKGIRIQQVLDPTPSTVTADSGRLQQVVWNLLSNAIKFTPKGGLVQVLLKRVNSHIELSVSDTGIGIAADFLPHVFDRFAQLDGSTSRSHGGLGLGLAIAKQLVELHGGTVRAASRGEGRGATFFVELPLTMVPVQDEPPPELPAAAAPGEDRVGWPRLDGLHLCVVDDEFDSRELLRRVLEERGARVARFDSAEQALKWLETTRPSVIVSDVGLPKMDGLQFIKALRAREGLDDQVPALALTAFARPEDRKRALLAGYHAHLAKPFDLGEFVLLVARLAGR